MILVVGATGNLGRKVVRSLLASGDQVRAMTRVVAKADELKALGARPVRADLTDPESLDFAMNGARVLVLAAHAFLGRGSQSSELIDDEGHRAIIDRAKGAGVEHIIYTSVMGASPNHPVDFWRTKARVEQHIRDTGVPFTIIRPSSFMEIYAYELIGKSIVNGKKVMLIGKGANPRNYVAAEDVAKVVVGALRVPSLRGETIDVGGPENLTPLQVVEIFERVTGKQAKVGHIPLGVARVLARVMKPVHPGLSRVAQAAVIAETTDQTFDPAQLRAKVPVTLTTLEEWTRARIREQ